MLERRKREVLKEFSFSSQLELVLDRLRITAAKHCCCNIYLGAEVSGVRLLQQSVHL